MLADEVRAVRTAATLADAPELACIRVGGADAHAALDRISPRDLFVRPGQMVHTAILDAGATPICDLYIACDEDDYLLVGDGLDGRAIADHVRAHAGGLDVAVEDQTPRRGFLTLDGPYAWEVLAAVASPDVIGLPYLGFYHEPRFTCFRAGRTGEYGYYLSIERDRIAEVRAAFETAGARFDLAAVGRDALDACALESWFWNPRFDVRPGLTPIELQLQWRVSYARTFPGSDALAARRGTARQRAMLVISDGELATDAAVALDGEPAGTLLHAGRSHSCGGWIAVALLDRSVAHVGVTLTSGASELRVVSAPAVNNRSLFVDPQRHSYLTRAQDTFPPLVRR